MPVVTEAHHRRIAEMTFASVDPCCVTKVEKKGRTVAELHTVLTWSTSWPRAGRWTASFVLRADQP